MADYRLYRLDGAGQITGAAEVLKADGDKEAVASAKALKRPHRCEVWQGGRLVARVPAAKG